jgi:hypothetical protein
MDLAGTRRWYQGHHGALPIRLSGPKTAALGCSAPCTPIQNRHGENILRRKTLR